ncbi:MAG TPA: tyrosine-type recombinase/integrase [Polyangia bacterium]|nr:tyrosine-type recombinase/integrase [Polyangia bacterium]
MVIEDVPSPGPGEVLVRVMAAGVVPWDAIIREGKSKVSPQPPLTLTKRLPDYLRPYEVNPLLASLKPKWKPLFATALYTGMRKGELFALQKADVDFTAGLILVSRSHDRDIPKGGRVEAVPINSELNTYLRKAIAASPSELVFPDEEGKMLPKHTALEHVLRRAMRRAGIVTGYVHKCRRQGCGHHEAAVDANPRRCLNCKFKLFPVGEVRRIRFHHLRHTTASLLLMQGADLAAVQRIMRHQDPRITTEVYGHLAPGYLKHEINRLSFGPPPADLSAGGAPAGDGAAPEVPRSSRARSRRAAPRSRRSSPSCALTRIQRLRLLPGCYPTPRRLTRPYAPPSRWKGSTRT